MVKVNTRPQVGYRLYRFYNADGDLLYIGQTGRFPIHRLGEHLRDKPWVAQIARWQVDPRVWSTEREVLAAEERAIRTEKPKHNVVHNDGRPWQEPILDAVARLEPSDKRLRVAIAATIVAVWLGAAAVMWWLTSDRPQAVLLLLAGALLIRYLLVCYFRPFSNCRKCKGSGKRDKWHGRRQADCKGCEGSGLQLRLGRRAWNHWRRRSQPLG